MITHFIKAKMDELKAIEVAEIGVIKVNGKPGHNIFTAANEAVHLSNLLKIAVELNWNGSTILVLRNTTSSEIVSKIFGNEEV